MQGECKISSFYLSVSNVNQGNEDLGCKKGSRFSLVAQGTERCSLDLLRAAKKNVTWKWGCGAVWNSWSQLIFGEKIFCLYKLRLRQAVRKLVCGNLTRTEEGCN